MIETQTLVAARVPTVYFIDDSATMREVIKIAFRKEHINVITCADASSALAQFEENAPDAVITDVIMPDKDGYEVCEFIKGHEQLGKIPVILMSGVVNRGVAEKAMAVKADELVRKPFQPQDLIARVKSLLNPAAVHGASLRDEETNATEASRVLGGLFSAPPVAEHPPAPSALPAYRPMSPSAPAAAPRVAAPPVAVAPPMQRAQPVPAAETQKLRNEVSRLALLVKKLQAELEAQRQYCTALEAHCKTLQDAE
ncbi:MAG TPA: response regulator [Candidatus Acidoferrales bacterium]